MPQQMLSFKYEKDPTNNKLTALGGLPLYLDLMTSLGFIQSLRKCLDPKELGNGWSMSDVVISLILVNLAGGDCVEDLDMLNADLGFSRVMELVHRAGYSRQQRRALQRKLLKLKLRKLPSKSPAFRRLEEFHNVEEEQEKTNRRAAAEHTGEGKAYIQKPNQKLRTLMDMVRIFLAALQKRSPQSVATLDQDATLVETFKEEALYCYKKYKAYQPLNTYWAEQGVVLHTEFRDGNVPAGYEELRVFKDALNNLPEGVTKVLFRADTAAYQLDLLKYCAEGKSERFGVIEFAVGADVTAEFKKHVAQVPEAEWKPLVREADGMQLTTGQEWAQVEYEPNWIAHKKNGPRVRFLAIREPLLQLELPGVVPQQELPFPTMEFEQQGRQVRHKLFGVITNRTMSGDEIIWWHRKRCGYSEQVHLVMKEDLAGGKLPSGKFGVNAAWWQIMVLALNLAEVMKRLVLEGTWVKKRMKALRFHLINIAGRVIERGRQIRIRLSGEHPAFGLICQARKRIAALAAMET